MYDLNFEMNKKKTKSVVELEENQFNNERNFEEPHFLL